MNEYTPATRHRQCSHCGVEYPATTEFFYRKKDGKYGLQTVCKACAKKKSAEWQKANRNRANEYQRHWYRKNREKVREKQRQYVAANYEVVLERNRRWHRANKEREAETHRAWYAANREREQEKRRAYYRANKEQILERTRRYYRENKELYNRWSRKWRKDKPDRVREHNARRRARVINASGIHTEEDVRRQYESQGGKCWWCGKPVGNNYHVDHRIPLSRGGTNNPENLVIACPFCNLYS